MTIQNKVFEDIIYDDIEHLINDKVSESIYLEFKLDFPVNDDPPKNKYVKSEIAKDITGIANASGGKIIYGIQENKGVAEKIIGIECNRGNTPVHNWLNDIMTNGGVTYKAGYKTKTIKIPNSDKIVFILDIPESLSKPHMVKFNSEETAAGYYIRSESSVKRATHQDVSHMFEFKNSFLSKFYDFKKEIGLTPPDYNMAKDSFKPGNTPLTPNLSEESAIDQTILNYTLINFIPYNLNRNINFLRDDQFTSYISKYYTVADRVLTDLPNTYTNSHGLTYKTGRNKNKYLSYFHIYKNGSIEWAKSLTTPNGNVKDEEKFFLHYEWVIKSIIVLLYHQITLSTFIESEQWNLQITLPQLFNTNLWGSSNIIGHNTFLENFLVIDIDYSKDKLNPNDIKQLVSNISDELVVAFGEKWLFEDMADQMNLDQFIINLEKELCLT
jgi:hypothetical protein